MFQEAEFQEAQFQEALFHEAEFQEALFQEAFDFAALFQEALSKLYVLPLPPLVLLDVTYFSSARFGFGGLFWSIAGFAWITPTPPPLHALREARRGEHQRALDLVGREERVLREDVRRRARDDRGRERGARELHVAGRGDLVGPLRDERRAGRHRADHVAARAPRPRASRSRRPSSPTPTRARRVALCGSFEPFRSAAPTVITNGSSPGL